MGCIYNGVCSSLVALFLWQQVTHFAAVIVHCGISPSRYGHTFGRRLGSATQFPSNFVGNVHIACLLLRARSAYGDLSQ